MILQIPLHRITCRKINRAIIPLVYQGGAFIGDTRVGGSVVPGGTTEFVIAGRELESQFGIGDIVYQGFISPSKAGKVIWGFGPQLNIPTGMGRMSTNHWSMGPAAVALMMPGHWVIGALVSNVWSMTTTTACSMATHVMMALNAVLVAVSIPALLTAQMISPTWRLNWV